MGRESLPGHHSRKIYQALAGIGVAVGVGSAQAAWVVEFTDTAGHVREIACPGYWGCIRFDGEFTYYDPADMTRWYSEGPHRIRVFDGALTAARTYALCDFSMHTERVECDVSEVFFADGMEVTAQPP